ncbi:MAG: Uma2 family endonuclease [Planctomycetota bacterium]|nr:MAG: Uma2 family endonuclease [Planctomycetota bacterium]REJ91033.1 MAG: Uma2 family endonuclease [Planctomycetota bacterium]REK31007.1 MAG: Uma2 family endonuclease [Planctomycetota bacterium]REK36876.1 MAG: Uma2 family endonuclease [Planctomycetota bacterium]
MATAVTAARIQRIGPEHNGVRLSPDEFDAIDDWDPAYRYELIRGVVVVNPIPLEGEVDPNEELGHLLREYRDSHPHGRSLDRTLPERYVYLSDGSRRQADRVIWTGLGRRPRPKHDVPNIVVEFVSQSKRDVLRDYVDKKAEYLDLGVKEYWVIDRFRRTMTVFCPGGETVVNEDALYQTDLLPGFVLELRRLFSLADDWGDE